MRATLLLLSFSILLPGCGTLNRSHSIEPTLYPATKLDMRLVSLCYSCPPSMCNIERDSPWYRLSLCPFFLLIGLIDLPSSLIFDTLLIPHDMRRVRDVKSVQTEEKSGKTEQ